MLEEVHHDQKLEDDSLPDSWGPFYEYDGQFDKHLESVEEGGSSAMRVGFYKPKKKEWEIRLLVSDGGTDYISGQQWYLPADGPKNIDVPEYHHHRNRWVDARFGGGVDGRPIHHRFVFGFFQSLHVFLQCLRGNEFVIEDLHDEDWSPEWD